MKNKVKYVSIEVPVRYEEEDIPYDYPMRKNDMWSILVEVETGIIINWPKDIEAMHLYMKVTDTGIYKILDENKEVISSLEDSYVPDSHSIPGSYGDYLDLKIDVNGCITNWYKNPTYDEFFSSEEEDQEY